MDLDITFKEADVDLLQFDYEGTEVLRLEPNGDLYMHKKLLAKNILSQKILKEIFKWT